MLGDPALSPEDRKYVLQALQDHKSTGAINAKMAMLSKVRIVGVTCAAAVFAVLDGNTFPIVILDECSQMVEPLVCASRDPRGH